jgi:hypothetical protein
VPVRRKLRDFLRARFFSSMPESEECCPTSHLAKKIAIRAFDAGESAQRRR